MWVLVKWVKIQFYCSDQRGLGNYGGKVFIWIELMYWEIGRKIVIFGVWVVGLIVSSLGIEVSIRFRWCFWMWMFSFIFGQG